VTTILEQARADLYANMNERGLLSVVGQKRVPSMADGDSKPSVSIASAMARRLSPTVRSTRLDGQTAGKIFEEEVTTFLRTTFPLLSSIRPGNWEVTRITGTSKSVIGDYEPYRHLEKLSQAVKNDRTLGALIGDSYAILPDVVVTRGPETDTQINASQPQDFVDDTLAHRTIIRQSNNPSRILHAVVSCKWTMRSDRAQNTRSEALSLVRGRKGRLPHIVAVTAEPLPSRLASLALGTGDLDMVYHLALHELMDAVDAEGDDTSKDLIETMVEGQRLRDIADLPLDLTV